MRCAWKALVNCYCGVCCCCRLYIIMYLLSIFIRAAPFLVNYSRPVCTIVSESVTVSRSFYHHTRLTELKGTWVCSFYFIFLLFKVTFSSIDIQSVFASQPHMTTIWTDKKKCRKTKATRVQFKSLVKSITERKREIER